MPSSLATARRRLLAARRRLRPPHPVFPPTAAPFAPLNLAQSLPATGPGVAGPVPPQTALPLPVRLLGAGYDCMHQCGLPEA